MKFAVTFWLCAAAYGQSFSQRGYVETQFSLFPETTFNDSAHFTGTAILRWDASYRVVPWLTLTGGIDAQFDTHRQVDRAAHIDWQERGLLRPLLELREFKATVHKGHVTADIGKQFIRWGTADILNPTDRFAPRDYLGVVDTEFLGVLGARAVVESAFATVDLVATRFTPSRMPLLDQRWTIVPPDLIEPFENAATHFPAGAQYGARVKHIGHAYEASVSYFDGYNHNPLLGPPGNVPSTAAPGFGVVPVIYVERFYPKIRTYGADAAITLPWFTAKLEGAYFQSRVPQASTLPKPDDYFLYVIQAERQVREWTFVGGYAGDAVTEARGAVSFDPERGLARAFLARAGYNIDARRTVAIEIAERQDGDGTWVRGEYSHLLGAHWRATAEVVAILGGSADFLGQYRHNSHATLKIRYSF